MPPRYGWTLVLLSLAAVCQCWCTGVLLVARESDALLCGGIMACVFWGWSLWAAFLRNRRLGVLLSGVCLLFTLALTVLGMLGTLDNSDLPLLHGEGGRTDGPTIPPAPPGGSVAATRPPIPGGVACWRFG